MLLFIVFVSDLLQGVSVLRRLIFRVDTRIAIYVLKQSNFSYTSYIEECCQSLYDKPEHLYDKYLIYIVQLQRLAEKIDRLSASHGQELMRPGSGTELYVIDMKSDLEAFQRRLPFNIDEAREWI